MDGFVEGARFEVVEPEFKALVPPPERVKRLWTGGTWLEGPAWFAAHGLLVCSDIPNDRMLRHDASTGTTSIWRSPARNSNGNTVDREGRLVTCEHGSRSVTRTEHDGTVTTLASEYDGRRLNSPNDAVVASDGGVWFTDPAYGIDNDYEGHAAPMEQDGCHLYRIDPTGRLDRVGDDFVRPNGLAFSPDESVLYVADTGATHVEDGPRHIRKFRVDDLGGRLSGGEVWAECTNGLFDGFRVDTEGRVWSSAADGVHCLNAGGELIGKVRLPEVVANLAFTGPKRNRLMICGSSSLYAVRVNATGAARG